MYNKYVASTRNFTDVVENVFWLIEDGNVDFLGIDNAAACTTIRTMILFRLYIDKRQ